MTRWMRDFRLIPFVLIAVGCLFALKTIGLMTEGGYTLGQRLGGSGTLVVTTIPGASVAQMRSPAVPLEVPSARPQGPKAEIGWRTNKADVTHATGPTSASSSIDRMAGPRPHGLEPLPTFAAIGHRFRLRRLPRIAPETPG